MGSAATTATTRITENAAAGTRPLDALVDDTRERCTRRLREPDLAEVARRVATVGIDTNAASALVGDVTERADTRDPVVTVKSALPPAVAGAASVERWLLLNAAIEALPKLTTLPVPRSVVELFCDEFQYVADAPPDADSMFDVRRSTFVDLAKKATLRRFPAGQFDWEVSGISRRYVLRVPVTAMPRVAAFVIARMHGLGPVFFSHLNPRRPSVSLREDEALRSYYRMAEAMRLQPEIIGFGACSWFRSPDTHAVSPHLAWVSRVVVENGGLVVTAGRADPECGVLHRSATRRRLFESGEFVPTEGLVMWPRRAMLAWAASHPELG